MEIVNDMVSFVKNNNEVISVLVGILSILVSLVGVYFGRKAYYVAKEIFEKGLQIDRQKVLQQISLEFVVGFFIPLAKFNASTQSIRNKTYDKLKVTYVGELINDNRFSVQFPYFDVHKGDVWESLIICKNQEQSSAFNTILAFVEKARNFDRAITDLSGRLNDYLNPQDIAEGKRRRESSLNDFFNACPNINQDMFRQGLQMVEELSHYEDELPEELKIREMKQKLLRI